MDKAKILKSLIEKKGYTSLKTFAHDCNIPYTTVYTILQKGVGKANVNNVIAMCQQLNITVEYLYNISDTSKQKNKNKTEVDKCNLNEKEQELIDNYRNLTEKGQEKLTEYTVDLLSAPKYNRHNTNDIIYENAYKKFKNYPEEQEDNIG